MTGIVSGLSIGNYFQSKAFYQHQAIAETQKLINQLQINILYNRPTQQLAPYLNSPEEFQVAIDQFRERVQKVKEILVNYRQADSASYWVKPEISDLLLIYEQDVEKFEEEINQFSQQVIPLLPSVRSTDLQAQDLVVNLAKSPEFAKFIEFPNALQNFDRELELKERELELKLLEARDLRNQIIFVSLILSVSLGSFFAFYTSKVISRPVQKVTEFSEKIIEDSNFDLQCSVTSDDEIEILANSLNQLILKVNELLKALHDKNTDLEQALSTVQKQQFRLIQAEKMSSLGQLVAGVAHEINNPVSFIYGNLQHLEEYSATLVKFVELYHQHYPHPVTEIQDYVETHEVDFLQEDLPKIIESMKLGSQRIREIVLSLRNFSRMDEAEYKEVNIHQGLDSTLMILQHRLREQPNRPEIQVSKNYADLPLVECYPGRLNQVFMNILVNAIDALEARPDRDRPLQIEMTTSYSEEAQEVQVSIADNGEGIPESIQPQIFNPFFTTKTVGGGTGMGLAISHQIMTETHQGDLICNSTPGIGTELVLKIPIHLSRQEGGK
ncbi:sensor histidine kinase [Roseofilum capinflatum]|uniref:histidine kinase n=1 Tax=Roseofilum capinflatum BLCC-M114 TaxID=3022440 RepID=A0ABT7BF29_9CYAN|nr:ATP-binding protein [Roseofilum capinflatum]MDJ1176888.1 ATP-binding protein [Roseofilum capinflatum BLCC-M114]